ncbi:MAG: hypothetical protein R3C68_13530 [Myxococcota bacterium]
MKQCQAQGISVEVLRASLGGRSVVLGWVAEVGWVSVVVGVVVSASGAFCVGARRTSGLMVLIGLDVTVFVLWLERASGWRGLPEPLRDLFG